MAEDDAPPVDLATAVLSPHAVASVVARGLSEDAVRRVLAAPGQWEYAGAGRIVCQSIVSEGGREMLLRVFIDIDRDPPEVVTAYRTGKIGKYWRSP